MEDAGLVTESRSINAGQGTLKAGTLLEEDGTKSSSSGGLYCVLAFDVDTGVSGTNGTLGVTTYIGGSFLRHTIEAASGFQLTDNQLADMRNKHIFVERSVG